MKIIQGNLLTSDEPIIAHQCNCVTTNSFGLANSIAQVYPWADHYLHRRISYANYAIYEDRDVPGTIKIYNNGQKIIICMFGQYMQGAPQKYRIIGDMVEDTKINRLEWFKMALGEIEKLKIERIAMPFMIGCGLAGGEWNQYYKILEEWNIKTGIEVVLYKIN